MALTELADLTLPPGKRLLGLDLGISVKIQIRALLLLQKNMA